MCYYAILFLLGNLALQQYKKNYGQSGVGLTPLPRVGLNALSEVGLNPSLKSVLLSILWVTIHAWQSTLGGTKLLTRRKIESGPLRTCRVHRRHLHRGYPIVLPYPRAILCGLSHSYTSTFLGKADPFRSKGEVG